MSHSLRNPVAIVLDANLLVLLIVGTASRSYISRHRRLRAYSEADFNLLLKSLAPASAVVVTPNTLSETSNLAGYISDPARSHIFTVFRELLRRLDERYIASTRAAERAEFIKLGLTDSGIMELLMSDHTLLTADLDLYLAAMRAGLRAINFNHYREANW